MQSFKLLVKSLFGTLLFLAILFVSAGRIDYWQGWLYATVNILCTVLNSLATKNHEGLAEERSGVKEGTKAWDKRIIGLSALALVFTYVVAGLDAGRFNWSPQFPLFVHMVGLGLIILGEVLFLLAQRQNRFFSSIMRIQTERGHTVCDSGIYSRIRHPAYLGSIFTALGIPLILGSLWSFIPATVSILLTIARTSLEDRALLKELEGYAAYAEKTRYRLFPFIW